MKRILLIGWCCATALLAAAAPPARADLTPFAMPALMEVPPDADDLVASISLRYTDGYLWMGREYAEQRDFTKAYRTYQKALEQAPDDPLLKKFLAPAAALAGRPDEAVYYFQQVLAEDPGNVNYLVAFAQLLLRQRRFEEAAGVAEQAVALAPGDLGAQFALACLEARDRPPHNTAYWGGLLIADLIRLLGWLNADRSDLVGALMPEGYRRLYEATLGLSREEDINRLGTHLDRALMESASGRWLAVATNLMAVYESGLRNKDVVMLLARALYETGDRENALALMEALAEHHPGDGLVWYNYGLVALQNRQPQPAIRAFGRATGLRPTDPQALFGMACAMTAAGDLDGAWPLLQRVAAYNPDEFAVLIAGDEPYLQIIRADPRYNQLLPARRP